MTSTTTSTTTSIPSQTSSTTPIEAAPFREGNLVIVSIRDTSLFYTVPVYIVEFTPTGSIVQNISLPTIASYVGTPFSILGCSAKTQTCTNDTLAQGFLSKSVDGRFLTLAGFSTAPGTPNADVLSRSSTIGRSVARIYYSSAIDTTTSFSGFHSSIGSIRGAMTIDGSGFWVSGYQDGTTLDGGILYISFGSNIPISLDLGSAKSYRAGLINPTLNTAYWGDQQTSSTGYADNRIEYMSPVNNVSQNIGGQQISGFTRPISNLMSFLILTNQLLLYVCDYGIGLRRFIRNSNINSFSEDLVNSPVYPSNSVLTDTRNTFGLIQLGDTLYVSTPSAVYIYDYINLVWGNNGEYILLASPETEFRGLALTPSSPTSSATTTSLSTLTPSVTGSSLATFSSTSSSSYSSTRTPTSTSLSTFTSTYTSTHSSTSLPTSSSTYTNTRTSTSSFTATSSQTSTSSVSAQPQPVVFSNPNSYQYVTIPINIVQARVHVWGAGGGAGGGSIGSSTFTGIGGGGAFLSGYLDVVPGETLRLIIGLGGSSGGGSGGSGGSGGGLTAIQRFINGDWTDLVIAGGGGGASGYYGTPPPGTWRTTGYGGGGGLTEGCDAEYEYPNNGLIFINQIQNGVLPPSCPVCSSNIQVYNCSTYGSGGGLGYSNGSGSCIGGGGGGSSYVGTLYGSLTQSAVCGSSQPGGMTNNFFSSNIATGGSFNNVRGGNGGNGTIVFQWVWPNPIYLPPSLTATSAPTSSATQTYNTLTGTKTIGASGTPSISFSPTPTPSMAIQAEVVSNHLACSFGPATAAIATVKCPQGSTIANMGFMGCGVFSGQCGNFEQTACNAMTKQTQFLITNTCSGSRNCSFTPAQLCSGPQDDDSCIGAELSYALQASCAPSTDMLNTQALNALGTLIGSSITPSTRIRYIRLSSTFELSGGEMGFSELQLLTKDGTNIALQGNATSSSVLTSSYGPNDYSICWGNSDIPSAAIDNDFCTFTAMNHDAAPWWELDLGYGVTLDQIEEFIIYTRQTYNNAYGATIDPSYQLDSALVTVMDEQRVVLFSHNLPWISMLYTTPFIVNVPSVLLAISDLYAGASTYTLLTDLGLTV